MPLTAPTSFARTVTATDGRGGSTPVAVAITLKPQVVVAGDLHGVEAAIGTKRDLIRLDFRRIASDVSAALTVTYTVVWTSAAEKDLDNPTALVADGQTEATITFAANEILKSITLTPKQDANLQGGGMEWLETFTVQIKTAGVTTYTSLAAGTSMEVDSIRAGLVVYEKVTVSILDDITLFATENSVPALKDTTVGTNGADLNDIKQGSVNDCFFMAAIGAMAQRTPSAQQAHSGAASGRHPATNSPSDCG